MAIRGSTVREGATASRFDRLIQALCQEHHDCLRHARESGVLMLRKTVGSRLSGDTSLDAEFGGNASLSLSGVLTNSGEYSTKLISKPASSRRRVSYLEFSDASVQDFEADESTRAGLEGWDSLEKSFCTVRFLSHDRKDVSQFDDPRFVSQATTSLAMSMPGCESEPSLLGSRSQSTSRGKNFELRQSWHEKEWDRPSLRSTRSTIRSHSGLLDEDSVEEDIMHLTDACVIHPNSRRRVAWNVLCFVFILYDIIIVPLQVFNLEDAEVIQAADWMVRVTWTLDMPISCFVGFYFKGRLHMSFQATRYRYLTTWFLFDLLLVLSDWLLFFVTAESSYGKLLRVARIARLLRVLRLVKVRGLLQTIEAVINTETMAIYFRCVKPLFAVTLLTHVLACGWFGVGIWDDGYEHNWVTKAHISERSKGYQYATSLHWSLAQFTLNTMDVHARNLGERLYTIAVSLVGIIGFSVLVSGFTSAAEQLREIKSDETKQFWLLRRFTRDYEISHKLSYRVVRYCEYKYLDQKARIQPEEVSLLKLLSEQLRLELGTEMHLPLLTPHPLFARMQEMRHRSLRDICFNLSQQSYARGDSFLVKGEDSTGMIMITHGEANYSYSENKCKLQDRLTTGQWLCEPSLWTYWTTMGDAKAVVHSRVLVVFADVLERVSAVAPIYEFMYMQRYAQKFVSMLNSLSRDALTDIVDQMLLSEDNFPRLCSQNNLGTMQDFVQNLRRRFSSHHRGHTPKTSGSSVDSRSRHHEVEQSPNNSATFAPSESKPDTTDYDLQCSPALGHYIVESTTTCDSFHKPVDGSLLGDRLHL